MQRLRAAGIRTFAEGRDNRALLPNLVSPGWGMLNHKRLNASDIVEVSLLRLESTVTVEVFSWAIAALLLLGTSGMDGHVFL